MIEDFTTWEDITPSRSARVIMKLKHYWWRFLVLIRLHKIHPFYYLTMERGYREDENGEPYGDIMCFVYIYKDKDRLKLLDTMVFSGETEAHRWIANP